MAITIRRIGGEKSWFCHLHHFFSTSTENAASSISDIEGEFKSLCSTGRMKEAFKAYNAEIWTDQHLFSYLIQSLIPKKSLFIAKQLHSLVITSGYYFKDKFVRNHLLNMYTKMGEIHEAIAFFNAMPMPMRNIMSHNILINGHVQHGDLESAINLFDEMPERNVATWNAMVSGLIHFEFNENGLFLFREMHGLGFLPDEFTLGSVLRGCAGLRASYAGKQVHAYVLKYGYEFNLVVGSSLAHMYMKSSSLGEGERVIKVMPMRNVVAWNTLIAGNAQNGHSEGVLDLYNMMKMSGLRPDKITLVSVISSCAEMATLFQGQQIHAEAIKAGANSAVAVHSSLISMYSKCGCLEDSMKALLDCEHPDAVLWSSMIAAYGFHGRGEEAVHLFEHMEQEGVEGNDVTFLSLLYACSHNGLKEKGMGVFKMMTEKYGLKPRLEHYTCVVDLLGRSGCLDEAEAMIRSMPLEADVVVWKTFVAPFVSWVDVIPILISLDPQFSFVILGSLKFLYGLAGPHGAKNALGKRCQIACGERIEIVSEDRRALLLHKLGLPPCFPVTDMVSQIKSPSNCITFNLIDEEVEGLMDTEPAGCRARNRVYSRVGSFNDVAESPSLFSPLLEMVLLLDGPGCFLMLFRQHANKTCFAGERVDGGSLFSTCCCPILKAYDHGCMLIRWIWNRALPHYPLEVETDKSDITDTSFVLFAINAISWLQNGGFVWLTGSICKCFELISGRHFRLPL
ncbi:hypothetical protein SADUNF_Sadunf16G0067700 [Salix dunnii]|uniref:Pentatricopeptide repeat-containing protein n=1 Tax=Salix dunnii TaxID=1413687 RepID=A0A835J8B8_9ROSI|nr:hypothetical protein SADUNF_Sadunf16G0067700 [Salix dunnii]